MSITISTTETDYFLPDDGIQARTDFLKILLIPEETWLYVYAFNMPSLLQELLAMDTEGIPVHMLLDHTQSTTPGEHAALLTFAAQLKVGDVTVTSAGVGSASPGQISHSKAVISCAVDGGEKHCFEGSVNMSNSGWLQANTFRSFRSDTWANAVIQHFNEHRDWARTNHPEWQIPVGTSGGKTP